jgi:hypothetical protein
MQAHHACRSTHSARTVIGVLVDMTTLIALAAIACMFGLSACLGADARLAPLNGIADQSGGNTVWHAAAMPGTLYANVDKEAPFS